MRRLPMCISLSPEVIRTSRWRVSAGVAAAVAAVAVVPAGQAVGRAAAGLRTAPALPTRAQLAIVVLPKRALGPAANGLEIDIGSGFADNAATADATLDPSDTGRQLGRAGRITGYGLSYSILSCAPFLRRSGLVAIESSVDVFTSPRAADAFLTKQLLDARRLRGKEVEYGMLVASRTFAVDRIGDRTVGLGTTGEIGDWRAYETLVAFRAGALVGAVQVSRADRKSSRALAARLARMLAVRVRLAAAGTLKARPVSVPPYGRKGRAPLGGPDLATMALTRPDLPSGATLTRQGYVDDRDAIATYEREFDRSSARSGAASVESDVSLFRHAREARANFCGMRSLYGAAQIERYMRSWTGAPSARVEQRPSFRVGNESTGLVLRLPVSRDLPVATRAVLVHVRVERVIGSLIVVGPAASLRLADVQPLAAALAKRIRAGL
jgi:hypothetical protein